MAISCRCVPMPRSQGDLDGNGSPWGEARQPHAPAQRHSADGSARLRRLDRSEETWPLQLATFGGEKVLGCARGEGLPNERRRPAGRKTAMACPLRPSYDVLASVMPRNVLPRTERAMQHQLISGDNHIDLT